MNMSMMKELKEMLCHELEEITAQGELSPGSLDMVKNLTSSIKNIDKIIMFDKSGYSQRGNSYDSGNSYGHYVRGHYSRDGMGSSGYSSRYSRDSGNLMDRLNRMLEDAPSEADKEAIRRCMDSIR